ncbi:MAG: ABC transporter ATP-binding protein [Phormidesmis sp.]
MNHPLKGNPLKGNIQQSIQILKLVWQSAPRWTAGLFVLLLLQGLLPIAFLYISKLVLDSISPSLNAPNIGSLSDPFNTYPSLVPLLLLAGAIALLSIGLSSITELVNTAQSEKVTNAIQDILHEKSIAVDLEYYENPQYHDALQRAQQESSFRCNQILTSLADVFKNGILLTALTGLLISLHWGIVALLAAATLPALFIRVKYTRVLYQWQRKRTALQRQAFYTSRLLTNEQFAKEIRLFNLGTFLRSQYRKLQTQIYREKVAIALKQSFYSFSAQLLGGGFLLIGYGYIIYQAIKGDLTLGDLALYYQAMQRGQTALKQFLGSLSRLYENNLFLKNFFEFLNLTPKVLEPSHPKILPAIFQQGLVFDRVSFQYPDTQRQALRDISLSVAPGETIALVGENGSGKTTLIKLLCRLYDPTAGHIYLENADIQDYAIADLRRQVSVIFQDYAKYHLPARDNIGFGNVDQHQNFEKIEAAACQSGADDVIRKLPHGYDTVLGKLFDQGEELSIGQWQKVALARAFLRDSQIIVLDEPTAAMDPKAEYRVFQNLQQLARHQAVILISHRMSTVRMANRIYVMEQGKIVECGSHSELMTHRGLYFQMFETQAAKYR